MYRETAFLLMICGTLLLLLLLSSCGKAQPPGGVYSNCCSFSQTACKHIPIDPNFREKDCRAYERLTGISCAIRKHFMRLARDHLFEYWHSRCPQNGFYTIVVNHTGPSLDEAHIVCEAASESFTLGPIWHGETRAFNNCDALINEQFGSGQASNRELWQKLTLYTTAEPCTMCMATSRWHRLGEMVYGVSITQTDNVGWSGIQLHSPDVQQNSNRCSFGGNPEVKTSYQTRLIKGVLDDELLPLFSWQFNPDAPCPSGCDRNALGQCAPL